MNIPYIDGSWGNSWKCLVMPAEGWLPRLSSLAGSQKTKVLGRKRALQDIASTSHVLSEKKMQASDKSI